MTRDHNDNVEKFSVSDFLNRLADLIKSLIEQKLIEQNVSASKLKSDRYINFFLKQFTQLAGFDTRVRLTILLCALERVSSVFPPDFLVHKEKIENLIINVFFRNMMVGNHQDDHSEKVTSNIIDLIPNNVLQDHMVYFMEVSSFISKLVDGGRAVFKSLDLSYSSQEYQQDLAANIENENFLEFSEILKNFQSYYSNPTQEKMRFFKQNESQVVEAEKIKKIGAFVDFLKNKVNEKREKFLSSNEFVSDYGRFENVLHVLDYVAYLDPIQSLPIVLTIYNLVSDEYDHQKFSLLFAVDNKLQIIESGAVQDYYRDVKCNASLSEDEFDASNIEDFLFTELNVNLKKNTIQITICRILNAFVQNDSELNLENLSNKIWNHLFEKIQNSLEGLHRDCGLKNTNNSSDEDFGAKGENIRFGGVLEDSDDSDDVLRDDEYQKNLWYISYIDKTVPEISRNVETAFNLSSGMDVLNKLREQIADFVLYVKILLKNQSILSLKKNNKLIFDMYFFVNYLIPSNSGEGIPVDFKQISLGELTKNFQKINSELKSLLGDEKDNISYATLPDTSLPDTSLPDTSKNKNNNTMIFSEGEKAKKPNIAKIFAVPDDPLFRWNERKTIDAKLDYWFSINPEKRNTIMAFSDDFAKVLTRHPEYGVLCRLEGGNLKNFLHDIKNCNGGKIKLDDIFKKYLSIANQSLFGNRR